MATTRDMTRDDTGTLIAADQVAGTNVYDTAGDKIGSIEDVMIDKTSGRIAYAVLSFGGFLGIGEKHHPLPWATLKYDRIQGGYVVGISKQVLQDAPSYDDDSAITWEDQAWGRKLHDYYGARPYWDIMP